MVAKFPIDESALLKMGMPRHIVTSLRETHATAAKADVTANTANVTANNVVSVVNAHIGDTNLDAHGDTAIAVVNLVGATFYDGTNIDFGSVSGSMIGTASTQMLGFWGATPSAQPATYTLNYSSTSKTSNALSAISVITTGSTNIAPFGYSTAAQADAIVTQVNALVVDMLNVKQVLTALLTDVKTIGVTG